MYTGSDDGYVHCLDANTGTQLWQTYAGGVINIIFALAWQPRSSPIIANGIVYLGGLDGKVYAIDSSTGNVDWTYQTGDPIGGTATYSQGIIYIASTDSYIYALNATNGNLIWKTITPNLVKTAGFDLFLVGSPVVSGGRLFIGGGGGGSGFLAVGVFIALNITDGSLLWSTNLLASTWPVFTPTVVGQNVYIDSGLYAVDLNTTTGAQIWRQFLGFKPPLHLHTQTTYSAQPKVNPPQSTSETTLAASNVLTQQQARQYQSTQQDHRCLHPPVSGKARSTSEVQTA